MSRSSVHRPQTNPTEIQIRRSCGTYQYKGRLVRLYQDPETGALEGMTHDGDPVDPLRVLTYGRKVPT
jgi:hypothetical protein